MRFLLPREGQPLTESTPPTAGLSGGHEHILLVEDEDALRRVARRALENVGYTVVTAADGMEALEAYYGRASTIDLIITDVAMPRLGGVELFRTLRRAGHGVRFLFTSGYAPEEMPQGGLGEEPALLQKPWTLIDLTRRVREVLDRARKD